MSLLPTSLQSVVQELAKLPGVGERSALRYAISLLRSGKKNISDLTRSLQHLDEDVDHCPNCHFWRQQKECSLCNNLRLKSECMCVVRDCPDVLALERFRVHGWRYHVLQGLLSPLNGIGPDKIRLDSLFRRIEGERVQEVILALDATIEGDATALYIRDQVEKKFPNLKLSRTALGLPAGSAVEYLDSSTLEHALNHRTNF